MQAQIIEKSQGKKTPHNKQEKTEDQETEELQDENIQEVGEVVTTHREQAGQIMQAQIMETKSQEKKTPHNKQEKTEEQETEELQDENIQEVATHKEQASHSAPESEERKTNTLGEREKEETTSGYALPKKWTTMQIAEEEESQIKALVSRKATGQDMLGNSEDETSTCIALIPCVAYHCSSTSLSQQHN